MDSREIIREKVYCQRCPIVSICYGPGIEPDNNSYAEDCILAKLYYGEIKVEVTGSILRD
uniref:Uncharacterized protein n=1 Tax=viral metagenome TaxID=1070528 RepID=A0A6M3IEZ6_9ZZZZ